MLGVAAPPVNAQQQRTDPQASSPAGVIYEIPFDTARRDAAPKSARGQRGGNSSSHQTSSGSVAGGSGTGGGPGTGAGGGGGTPPASASGGSGSSASATGSSASATGSSGTAASGASSAGSGAGTTGGGTSGASANPNVGTSIHSENGFGSSSNVPGVAGAKVLDDGPPASAVRASTSSTTIPSAATYGVLIVLVLVGGWIGLAASRGLRTG